MKYIIGNWKANKNLSEAQAWVDTFFSYDLEKLASEVTFVVCPPYPFLRLLSEKARDVANVSVGAQDLASHDTGPFTGDVAASSIVGMAEYALIGHSERRSVHKEQDEELHAKAQQAHTAGIVPVYCVRGPSDPLPDAITFVAYEPVHAIGTGQNEAPEKVVSVKGEISLPEKHVYIYGGSVNSSNAHKYLSHDEIDGVLPGGASLDPNEFYKIGASIS